MQPVSQFTGSRGPQRQLIEKFFGQSETDLTR